MTLEEFTDYVDYISEKEIPPILFKGLNMGIHVNPEKQEDKKEENYYVLGVYIQNSLGKQIILYYGTFWYFYHSASVEKWQKKILSTIKHEFIHHVEAMAGQEDLAHAENVAVYQRKRAKEKKHKKD